jgi:AraC-like DNA-binding protein
MPMLFPRKAPGAAPFVLWPAALALWGPGDRSALHAHHALQLILCRQGELTASWEGVPARRAGGVLVGSDVPHAVDAAGQEVLVAFIEPESGDGLRLASALAGPARGFSAAERDALLAGLGEPWAAEAVSAWLRRTLDGLVGAHAPARTLHPRVRRVLRWLHEEPAPTDVSLEALAQRAGLSPGRVMHVFTESLGVPLRPYLLWLRLQRATGTLMSGRSLGEAAHAAGFADAAHFSRAFRRMFGNAPSRLRRSSQFVQA